MKLLLSEYVADVHHCSLVSQMLHVYISAVEVHAFHKHVACHQRLLIGIVQHGAVVSYTIFCRLVSRLYVFCKMIYKPELTQFCYFHYFYLLNEE